MKLWNYFYCFRRFLSIGINALQILLLILLLLFITLLLPVSKVSTYLLINAIKIRCNQLCRFRLSFTNVRKYFYFMFLDQNGQELIHTARIWEDPLFSERLTDEVFPLFEIRILNLLFILIIPSNSYQDHILKSRSRIAAFHRQLC